MELLEELGGYKGHLKTSVLRSDRHFISRHIFSFHCDHNLQALVSVFGYEGKAPFQLGREGPSLLSALGREQECVLSLKARVLLLSHMGWSGVSFLF